MKNNSKNIKSRQVKPERLCAYVIYLSSLAFTVMFVFGCNQSPQTTYRRPDSTFVNNLMPEAVQILKQSLADQNPYIRVNAIEAVATTRQISLMPKVQRLLKDEFVPVRFAAALAVGDVEYRLAKRQVMQLLKDTDENVKIAAAFAMYKLGSTESFELLRKAITNKNQLVRANATMLMGKSGDKRAIEPLSWVMKDENSHPKVRFQAVESTAMLGDKEILAKIWPMLISAYADDRAMGIRALGALGTTKAKDVLITKLDDRILDIRLLAAGQLGMLGDTTGLPQVRDAFTNKSLTADLDKRGLERVNMLAAMAIGQIGDASLTKFLPQLMQNESKLVRLAAAQAVLRCAGKKG